MEKGSGLFARSPCSVVGDEMKGKSKEEGWGKALYLLKMEACCGQNRPP